MQPNLLLSPRTPFGLCVPSRGRSFCHAGLECELIAWAWVVAKLGKQITTTCDENPEHN